MTSSRVRLGQVQAHGALLALVEHDLAIASASVNAREILGVEAEQLLTASIACALDAPVEKVLRELPAEIGDVNPIEARTRDGRVLDAVLHRAAGMLVLELEPAGTPVRTGRIQRALDRLHEDPARVVHGLRELLGFDRVALYRGPEELIAAVGEPPAYVELAPGELRFVADRAAEPVALLDALPLYARTGEATADVLRPIAAPGTGALVVIAVGERGAVVCEHAVARHVPYSARAAAKVITRMAGTLLGMHDGRRRGAGALAGARVLVVDDDADQCDMLAMLLEAQGAITQVAGSATAGMEAFRQFHPDALLADIGLPDRDGYTFMRELRALGSDDGGWIPAIAVSGHAGAEHAHQAILAGFQLHIAKPIDPPDLVARLARLVGRTVRRT